MKHLFVLVGLICLIAMLMPACAPAPEPEPEAAPEPVLDQAAEEAAVRATMEQMYAAANKHDVNAYTALIDENFESWDGSIKGRVDWEKAVSDSWGGQKDRQLKPLEEIGIVFISPDVAIYKARDEISGEFDADGKPLPPQKMLRARVLVKKTGKWLYAALFQQTIEE